MQLINCINRLIGNAKRLIDKINRLNTGMIPLIHGTILLITFWRPGLGPGAAAPTHPLSPGGAPRALAGSLASFDTSSIVNTEGVPLLEENEFETEGSGNSVSRTT